MGHSEARLEAPGFIPAQWVAAAVLAGCTGGFKPPIATAKQYATQRENESREAKPYSLIIRVYRRVKHENGRREIAAE